MWPVVHYPFGPVEALLLPVGLSSLPLLLCATALPGVEDERGSSGSDLRPFCLIFFSSFLFLFSSFYIFEFVVGCRLLVIQSSVCDCSSGALSFVCISSPFIINFISSLLHDKCNTTSHICHSCFKCNTFKNQWNEQVDSHWINLGLRGERAMFNV